MIGIEPMAIAWKLVCCLKLFVHRKGVELRKLSLEEYKKNKNTAIIIGISAIVLALLLGIGFAWGSGSFSGSSTSNSEKKVTIPDIKGMLVDDATKELEKLGLKLKIYETVESDKAEGTILEMSPEANKTAKKGDVN